MSALSLRQSRASYTRLLSVSISGLLAGNVRTAHSLPKRSDFHMPPARRRARPINLAPLVILTQLCELLVGGCVRFDGRAQPGAWFCNCVSKLSRLLFFTEPYKFVTAPVTRNGITAPRMQPRLCFVFAGVTVCLFANGITCAKRVRRAIMGCRKAQREKCER